MKNMPNKQLLPSLVNSGIYGSNRYVNFHSHPGTELVLVSRGRCNMEVDDKVLEGKAGNLFILPTAREHNQINFGFVATIYLSFQWEAEFDDTPRILEVSGDRWIKLWLKQIYLMHHRFHDNFSELIPGILYSLLKRIGQLESPKQREQFFHPALKKAVEYIGYHLNKPVIIGEMAKYAGISPSYLCALFKKQFGKGPVTVALEAKMKYAERLLRDPYLSIKEAARSCGFSDSNYFSRFFRKHHGCTPGKFRKQMKN